MTLASAGVPTAGDLRLRTPPAERIQRGPVATIECFQEIPCDPCFHACKRGAITGFVGINSIPAVDFDRCNGCGLCLTCCPGLAIFVLSGNYDSERGLVRMAYEFLPRPHTGQEVAALDREGREICRGLVAEVREGEAQDRMVVVGVAIPRPFLMEVRNIKVEA